MKTRSDRSPVLFKGSDRRKMPQRGLPRQASIRQTGSRIPLDITPALLRHILTIRDAPLGTPVLAWLTFPWGLSGPCRPV